MSRASDPSRALQCLRDVEVPVGARSRVRARIESQIDRRAVAGGPSRRRWMIGMLAAPVVAIAIVALWPRPEGRALSVQVGERHDVALPSGHVSIRGPAEVTISHDELALVQGTVEAEGHLHVSGPTCDVLVQGSAEVTVSGAQLSVRVFAGSVQIAPPVVTCEVIELSPRRPITASGARKADSAAVASSPPPGTMSAPARSIVAAPDAEIAKPSSAHVAVPARERPEPRVAPPAGAPTSSRSTPEAPPLPSDVREGGTVDTAPRVVSSAEPPSDPLADEVAAYRAAVALEARDPAAAREAWQAWRARWPTSPLAQSVDLRLLAVLDRLGRHGEASDLAREFVRRYPRSPRRAEVQHLIMGER
jgi:hypothetical protein